MAKIRKRSNRDDKEKEVTHGQIAKTRMTTSSPGAIMAKESPEGGFVNLYHMLMGTRPDQKKKKRHKKISYQRARPDITRPTTKF